MSNFVVFMDFTAFIGRWQAINSFVITGYRRVFVDRKSKIAKLSESSEWIAEHSLFKENCMKELQFHTKIQMWKKRLETRRSTESPIPRSQKTTESKQLFGR